MKNEKLSLNSLKIKSFVTNTDKETSETIKGGNNSFIRCYSGTCQWYTRNNEIACEGGGTNNCPPEEVTYYC